MNIRDKEKFYYCYELAFRIAQESGRNLHRSLLILEHCSLQHDFVSNEITIPRQSWEILIEGIARDLFRRQTSEMLQHIKKKISELLCRCIPPDLFLRKLLRYLSSK